MDSSLGIAKSFVDEIGKLNETFIEVYFALRAKPDVKDIIRGIAASEPRSIRLPFFGLARKFSRCYMIGRF